MLAAEIVYSLCTLTSLVCVWLLLRGYRRSGTRLLMWSGLCFAGLCLNNAVLFVDNIILTQGVDLSIWRLLPALVGVALLCYGLVEEEA
ncbi:MAG TPA: DUF5985 family protein [Candidatus Baltobacteraceae bacterium]